VEKGKRGWGGPGGLSSHGVTDCPQYKVTEKDQKKHEVGTGRKPKKKTRDCFAKKNNISKKKKKFREKKKETWKGKTNKEEVRR